MGKDAERETHDMQAVTSGTKLEKDFHGMDATEGTLVELGYRSELKREFSLFSAFSFALSVSGLFSTIGTTFSYPFLAGGSASVVWCWLISGVGCLCIAFSVAELVSAYPTSGGLYYSCSRVFPAKAAPFLCWVDGWVNLLGQIAGVASSDYGAAGMILTAASIGSGLKEDTESGPVFNYEPTDNHTVGVMAGVLIFQGIISCLPTKYLEKVTKWYVVFHYAALISAVIALLVKTEPRQNADYVFTNVESQSGWKPIGWSFVFGFLSVSWTMTDYDATAHICEEMEEPERKAPWAISMAMVFTFVTGFLYNIVLCFCIPKHKEEVLANASQPVVMLYYYSLGKGGSIAFAVFMFVVMNFLGLAALQATSRTMWAQARDQMFPWAWKYLYHVNRITTTPVNAVALSTALCIAINLIALGSQETINAIFNVTAIALDWSYCLPILGKCLYPKLYKKGPWNLGVFSTFINWYACIWTLFASIIFFMPTEMPVTKDNMNYAVVFFVFVIGGSILCWFLGGSKIYTGPKPTAGDPEAEVKAQKAAEKQHMILEEKESENSSTTN